MMYVMSKTVDVLQIRPATRIYKFTNRIQVVGPLCLSFSRSLVYSLYSLHTFSIICSHTYILFPGGTCLLQVLFLFSQCHMQKDWFLPNEWMISTNCFIICFYNWNRFRSATYYGWLFFGSYELYRHSVLLCYGSNIVADLYY